MRARGFRWSATTLPMIERGERVLKFPEAVRLAEELGTALETFASDEGLPEDLAALRSLVRYAEDRWRVAGNAWAEFAAAQQAVRAELSKLDREREGDDEFYLIVVASMIAGHELADLEGQGVTYPGPGDGER